MNNPVYVIPYLIASSFNSIAVGTFQLATRLLSLENLLQTRSQLALCAYKPPEYDFLQVKFACRLVATLAQCAYFHSSLEEETTVW
jgi:hypothetical protein